MKKIISILLSIGIISAVLLFCICAQKNYIKLNKEKQERKQKQEEISGTAKWIIKLYTSDVDSYNTYKNTNITLAEEIRQRANKTALAYDKFLEENAYAWDSKENIPSDINITLPLIE